jgi:hypothetical protein
MYMMVNLNPINLDLYGGASTGLIIGIVAAVVVIIIVIVVVVVVTNQISAETTVDTIVPDTTQLCSQCSASLWCAGSNGFCYDCPSESDMSRVGTGNFYCGKYNDAANSEKCEYLGDDDFVYSPAKCS